MFTPIFLSTYSLKSTILASSNSCPLFLRSFVLYYSPIPANAVHMHMSVWATL